MDVLHSNNNIIQRFINNIQLRLSTCDLCGANCQQHALLCKYCFKDLSLFNSTLIMGDLLNWPAINKALPNVSFDHLMCLAPYTWPFTQWMSQLKYQGRFEIANLFAHMLSDYWLKNRLQLKNNPPQLILSVPLHIKKWQSRGFNQAHLIAKIFSKSIDIPYSDKALERILHTKDQVGKSGSVRRKNLKNAFSFNAQYGELPEHVCLIDDVVTTGSTANEICQLLKTNGVTKVTLLSVCLSLPK